MRIRAIWLLALASILGGAAASKADVVVTLEAFTVDGQPITGPVAPGTNATVDILLSADAEDDPLTDVRLVQFDFDATGAGIALVAFTWSVNENGYSFQDPELPLTNVTSLLIGTSSDLITITSVPVKVASVDITVNASSTLDLINPANTDPNFGAEVRAGFSMQEQFHSMIGNIQGGVLAFTVTGGGGGGGGNPDPTDNDDDGVPNPDDAFPDDPDETTDTDGNGVGDNADPDDDGDTVVDEVDDFPTDPDEAVDSDDDGTGNNADEDDDNDGVIDVADGEPLDPEIGEDDDGNDDGGGSSGGGSTPQACGAGVLGSGLMLLFSLGLVSVGRGASRVTRSHR